MPTDILPGVQADLRKVLKFNEKIQACVSDALLGRADRMRSHILKLERLSKEQADICETLSETTDHL